MNSPLVMRTARRASTIRAAVVGTLATVIASLGSAGAAAHPGGDLLSLDSDGDGRISFDEFRLPEREDRRSMFARADTDGDGVVSRDDMQAAIDNANEERKEQLREHALQRFDEMDSDGNGVVTSDEVRQQMFARIDGNGDGFVTEDEADAMHDRRREMRGHKDRRGRRERGQQQESGSS